jgi:hypothetical protein
MHRENERAHASPSTYRHAVALYELYMCGSGCAVQARCRSPQRTHARHIYKVKLARRGQCACSSAVLRGEQEVLHVLTQICKQHAAT